MNDGASVLVLLVLAMIYFIPTIVASGRERSGGVVVVNLFFGWTLIGWVVALAWAASLPKAVKAFGPSGEVISSAPSVVVCPFCAEEIKPAAVICKHCGRDLPS